MKRWFEKRERESYADGVSESGTKASRELLSGGHLEEGGTSPLPSNLKQHGCGISFNGGCDGTRCFLAKSRAREAKMADCSHKTSMESDFDELQIVIINLMALSIDVFFFFFFFF